MPFACWDMIHGMWLVIFLGLFLFWRRSVRESLRSRFVGAGLLPEMAGSLDRIKEGLKISLILGVGFFSVLALMRPQWGFEWHEVKRQGVDILIALDTSKSMLTEDIKPNRLERAKLAVKDLLKILPGDRIGLIAFAGSAFVVCPLTVDYQGFAMTLDDTTVESIPQGGTAIVAAIKEAIHVYEKITGKYKAVVIITDGEDLEGGALEWAKTAAKKGIKIFCIGVGTPEGELIRLKDERGEYQFLKDKHGNIVKSRLNETLLKEMALATGAAYVRAGGVAWGLEEIYKQHLSRMEKKESASRMEKRFFERFQWPLALATLLLCLETVLSRRRKS